MMGLYMVSVLIFVRSIVRVVEYGQGNDGYIMTHEAFLYIFDGMMMLAAMAIMNVIHPGEVAKYVRQVGVKAGNARDTEARTGNGWEMIDKEQH